MKELRGQLLQNASLARYTTWRVGGCADQLYLPVDLEDLSNFLSQLPSNEPLMILGLGSNVLIRDAGLHGTVVLTQRGLNRIALNGNNIVNAEVGVSCAQLARFTARSALTGLEFFAGIPGTVGGALRMNAGCFGGETWQFVHSVKMINRQGDIVSYTPDQFEIKYRDVTIPKESWFVSGEFSLKTGDKEASLAMIRDLLNRRSATQPTGELNCGSVFRNPKDDYAGRLIESCGLKGYTIGGAHVSPKHTNFIINDGSATAADIESLINFVTERVKEVHEITLQREVKIIGDRSN